MGCEPGASQEGKVRCVAAEESRARARACARERARACEQPLGELCKLRRWSDWSDGMGDREGKGREVRERGEGK